MKVTRWLALLAWTTILFGCSKPATTPQANKDKDKDKVAATDKDKSKADKDKVKPPADKDKSAKTDKDKDKDKSKTNPDPVPMASGPKEAMEQLVNGLADNKPQVIWTALPPDYQKDVKEVFTAFANKMDPEVYNKTFATLRKAVNLLKVQKKNILALAKDAPPVLPIEQDQVEKGYDDVVEILNTVVNSELGKLEDLKNPDVEKMLSGSASKLMGQIMALAAKQPGLPPVAEIRNKVSIQVVKAEGDQAVLKFVADDQSKDVEMVKHEGKWLPKKMVDQWPMAIAEIKKNISEIPPDVLNKAKNLKILGVVDAELDKLAKAKSPEELQNMGAQAFGAIMQAYGMENKE